MRDVDRYEHISHDLVLCGASQSEMELACTTCASGAEPERLNFVRSEDRTDRPVLSIFQDRAGSSASERLHGCQAPSLSILL